MSDDNVSVMSGTTTTTTTLMIDDEIQDETLKSFLQCNCKTCFEMIKKTSSSTNTTHNHHHHYYYQQQEQSHHHRHFDYQFKANLDSTYSHHCEALSDDIHLQQDQQQQDDMLSNVDTITTISVRTTRSHPLFPSNIYDDCLSDNEEEERRSFHKVNNANTINNATTNFDHEMEFELSSQSTTNINCEMKNHFDEEIQDEQEINEKKLNETSFHEEFDDLMSTCIKSPIEETELIIDDFEDDYCEKDLSDDLHNDEIVTFDEELSFQKEDITNHELNKMQDKEPSLLEWNDNIHLDEHFTELGHDDNMKSRTSIVDHAAITATSIVDHVEQLIYQQEVNEPSSPLHSVAHEHFSKENDHLIEPVQLLNDLQTSMQSNSIILLSISDIIKENSNREQNKSEEEQMKRDDDIISNIEDISFEDDHYNSSPEKTDPEIQVCNDDVSMLLNDNSCQIEHCEILLYFVKGHLVRRSISNDINGLIIIQSCFRQGIESNRIYTLLNNINRIQSLWRLVIIRKQTQKIREHSVIKLQSLVRGVIQMRGKRQELDMIVFIQSAFRACIQRKCWNNSKNMIIATDDYCHSPNTMFNEIIPQFEEKDSKMKRKHKDMAQLRTVIDEDNEKISFYPPLLPKPFRSSKEKQSKKPKKEPKIEKEVVLYTSKTIQNTGKLSMIQSEIKRKNDEFYFDQVSMLNDTSTTIEEEQYEKEENEPVVVIVQKKKKIKLSNSTIPSFKKLDLTDDEIDQLIIKKEMLNKLNEEMNQLKEKENELKEISKNKIGKLHDYNKIKDLGQFLVEKLSTIENRTISQIYEEYSLNEND